MTEEILPGAMIREITIKSRRTGYVHRPIAVWNEHVLMLETGEIVDDVPSWILDAEPHLVVTQQVPWLVDVLLTIDSPALQIRLSDSRPDVPGPTTSKPKLVSFGRKPVKGARNKAQHTVLDIQKMMAETKGNSPDRTTGELLSIGLDVRLFCEEQDIPIKTSPAGIASALSTDKRFAPNGQYQVPKKVNEGVRKFLPGVRHTSHVAIRRVFRRATSLDQRRAYHRAAQSIPLPSPETLYARGHYASYEERPDKLWLVKADTAFRETLTKHHGLLIVQARQKVKPDPMAPRACHMAYKDTTGSGVQIGLWSNELDYAEHCGLDICGIYAAYTSPDTDKVLPLYGQFAETTIDAATDERALWLKGALHARWGLLGARARRLYMASASGKGRPALWRIGLRDIPVSETELPAFAPRATNVAALGMLQAQVETDTLSTAKMLGELGYTVLHTHADGLHILDDQIPILGPYWSAEPLTNLVYEDDVSWTSNERDVLPGRDVGRRKEALRQAAKRKHSYKPDLEPEPRGMFD